MVCNVSGLAGKDTTAWVKNGAPLWLLALVSFCGTFAMHIFVPALPDAALSFNEGTSVLNLTVSLYIVGLAIGQLVHGPISDRLGRRPVLAPIQN